MFTGLIEDIGTLTSLRTSRQGAVATVATTLPMAELRLGESIAIDGACLTVTAFSAGSFSADVSPETLARTTLGALHPGSKVNLERALRLGDRLGGHLVTGHIDGTAKIIERTLVGNAWRFSFQLEPLLCRLLVGKGSVAIDGISLTVNEAADDHFSVMIIPHTLAQTTLAGRQPGERVNIETDLLAKYVARLLAPGAAGGGVTLDLLAKSGFL